MFNEDYEDGCPEMYEDDFQDYPDDYYENDGQPDDLTELADFEQADEYFRPEMDHLDDCPW